MPNIPNKAVVLFDSSAQATCISKKLTRRLNLQIIDYRISKRLNVTNSGFSLINTVVGPIIAESGYIGRRTDSTTKSATKQQRTPTTISNLLSPTIKGFLLITMISMISKPVITIIVNGYLKPYNIPEKWNCDEIGYQNFTSVKVNVYTSTQIRITAIKCSNITRTICTKAFLRLSLSVIFDETTTSSTIPMGSLHLLDNNVGNLLPIQTTFIYKSYNLRIS
ncbi:hypothetical protein WUBG_13671 [Wuchereria bancrofti]|uniref:DUF1758 domain-containing protein n=1 Tax=Wuchereria bancrofti TaxID=6293 RepID=J9DZP4_WUCBA|nr:hypothetical protein WUBG_13671 [Wuchereria bancrofti]